MSMSKLTLPQLAGVSPDQIKIAWVSSPTSRRRQLLASKDKHAMQIAIEIVDIPRRRGIVTRLHARRMHLLKVSHWKSRNITVTRRRPLRK